MNAPTSPTLTRGMARTADRLPFSPLTHTELNARWDCANHALASWVRCVIRDEGSLAFTPSDEERILRHAQDAETYR